MKKINLIAILSITILSLGLNPSFASENSEKNAPQNKPIEITFDMAKKMALENSEKIKIQQEITDSISKTYEYKKKYTFEIDPLSKTYEDPLNPIKTYSQTRTKDYKYLDKIEKQKLLEDNINNKNKTLELFVNIIELENSKKLEEINLSKISMDQKASKSLYDTGNITLTKYNTILSEENKIKSNLQDIDNNITLAREKFKNHLGLDNDNFTIILEEPKEIISPRDALINAKKDTKIFKDLQEDIDELNEDMNKTKLFSIGTGNYNENVDDQQEKIDDKLDDYKNASKDKLNELQNIEKEILIRANNILTLKKDLDIAQNNLNKNNLLFDKGLITPIKVKEMEVNIDSIKLSMIKNNLEIENLIQKYEDSQIL